MQMLARYTRWGFMMNHPGGLGVYYIVDEQNASPDPSKMKTFSHLLDAIAWVNKSPWVEKEGDFARWADNNKLFEVSVIVEVRRE